MTANEDCKGYVLFWRSHPTWNMDLERFCIYRNTVFLPYPERVRRIKNKYKMEKGKPVPKELSAVSWFDGDNSQVKIITSEEQCGIEKLLALIKNKHSAARTGTEQPVEVTIAFCVLKYLTRVVTVSNTPSAHGLYRDLDAAFKKHENVLKSKTRKRSVLLDFLATLPTIVSAACGPETIHQGFVEAGMVDEKAKNCPDFENIVATCHQTVITDELRLCHESFGPLLKYQLEHGHVPDNIYKQLGFRRDRNEKDEEVR